MKKNLIVLSAPSGTGKTTICKELLKRNKDWIFSVSATTRPPREGEVDGKDYVIKRGLKRGKTSVTQDFGYIIKDGIKEEKTALELKQKVLTKILDQ